MNLPLILVLEDDDNLRDMLVEILTECGYSALGACDCEEALMLGEQVDFQIAVSDIRMAGRLDGLGTMQVLKQKNAGMGCIIITGYADPTSPARAAQIQADDYLYKPIEFSDFLAAVQRVASKSSERSRYTSVLKGWLAVPQNLINAGKREALIDSIDQMRTQVLQAYFVKLRARDTLLTKSAARDLWDEIEELDVQFSLCFHHLKEFSPALLQEMLTQYQQIYEQLCEAAASQRLGSLRARDQQQVDRITFFRFYDRVISGQISSEQFRLAAVVRRLHPSRRHDELDQLYQALWT